MSPGVKANVRRSAISLDGVGAPPEGSACPGVASVSTNVSLLVKWDLLTAGLSTECDVCQPHRREVTRVPPCILEHRSQPTDLVHDSRLARPKPATAPTGELP